ncbi:MAG: PLxRFG domain-containing protein, partial [Rhodanobacter sp.]
MTDASGIQWDDEAPAQGSPTLTRQPVSSNASPTASPTTNGIVWDDQKAAQPSAAAPADSGKVAWLKQQLGGSGDQDYGQGLGYLIDNPVTRGLGQAANTIGTGASEIAQRGVGLVSPDAAAWLKRNVTTPMAERGQQLETPKSAGLGSDAVQFLSNLGGQLDAAGLTAGVGPEAEAASATPGIVGKVASYLTPSALRGASLLGVTGAGNDAAQTEAQGGAPVSNAKLAGMALTDTAANLVPMARSGWNLPTRLLSGAAAGEASNEAQNYINGNPAGTGALVAATMGAGLGFLHRAPVAVPHPDAAPGSLSDVVNTLHETNAAQSTAVAGADQPVVTAPVAAAQAASQTRVQPASPPWIDPITGELGTPSKDDLTSALASHMLQQRQATGDMRVNTQQIADAWGVPKDQVARARSNATQMAMDQIAQDERAAMNPQQAQTDQGAQSGAAPRSFGDIQSDIDQTHDAASQRFDQALQLKSAAQPSENTDTTDPAVQSALANGTAPGQPLHPWTPINDSVSVPYTGGVSTDGRTILMDHAMPDTVTVDGKDIPAKDPVAYHESVEFPLMHLSGPMSDGDLQGLAERAGFKSADELPNQAAVQDLKDGKALDYAKAHQIATLSENHYVRQKYNVDPDKYQAALTDAIDTARKEAPGASDVPSNLDPKPYVDMGEDSLAKGIEPGDHEVDTNANDSTANPSDVAQAAASAETSGKADEKSATDNAAGQAGGTQEPAVPMRADVASERSAGATDTPLKVARTATEITGPKTPPAGGVSASADVAGKDNARPSAAARDAEGFRVKTPDGEMNGRSHVDQLVRDGYTKVESTRAGDKMVHSLVNDAGEHEPIKARQLKYAHEATARAGELSARSPIDNAAHEAATSPHNDLPEPTPAQIDAGNYKKGHVQVHGMDISIENPKGSTRSGVGEDGKPWSHEMSDHYGYVRGTVGADGDHVDVYVGPKPDSKRVFVVDQIDQKTGAFDEHKAMIGFTNKSDAVRAYKSNFDPGWKVGPVTDMNVDRFKNWLKNGDTKKPASGLLQASKGSAESQKVLFRKDEPIKGESPFYSAALRTVEEAKGAPKQADAAGWKGWLDGAVRRGDMKQSERDWLGIDQWLKDQTGKVSRDQLTKFVRDNQVEIKEVTRGGDGDGYVRDTDGNRVQDGQGGFVERAKNGPTKFSQHQLPGGENYKELLLAIPEQKTTKPYNKWLHENYTGVDSPEAQSLYSTQQEPGKNFTSGHFDTPNVLAHVRFNERTDTDGRKVLFLEEVQSDWHQSGRKNGYANEPVAARFDTKEKAEKANARVGGTGAVQVGDQWSFIPNSSKRVPNAPFKSTTQWSMLAFKRMVRYAAEHGMDRIAWTTGDQQAARYDLSKQVDSILHSKNADGTYKVSAVVNHYGNMLGERIPEDELENHVGKEVAKKIVAGEGARTAVSTPMDEPQRYMNQLSGVDLKVGGEGMKAFYDKMLPNEVNKWAKPFDAKVGSTDIPAERVGSQYAYTGPEHSLSDVEKLFKTTSEGGPGEYISPLTGKKLDTQINRVANQQAVKPILKAMRDGSSFKDAIERNGDDLTAHTAGELFGGELSPREQLTATSTHSIDITPKMREAALGGMPLFNKEGKASAGHNQRTSEVAHTAKIKDATDQLTSRWKGDDVPAVHVVPNVEALPDQFKVDPNSYKTARGAYDGKGVWVVADRHADTAAGHAELVRTITHEVVGHYGVERIVSRELGADAWSKIRDSVTHLETEGKGSDAMKSVLADVRKRYGSDIDADTYARETLAVMAERGIKNGLLDRAIAAVRQFVRKMMPDLKLSEHELRQLLVKSDEYLQHGESYRDRVQNRAATSFSRDGWDKDFPDTVTAHTPGFVRDHPDYAAAKAGDPEAAMRLARDAVTHEFVQKVKDGIPEGSDPVIVPVMAREAGGENRIPQMAAEVLADRLGLKTDDNIMQTDKVSRSGSDAIHRLANQPAFDGKVEPGRNYVLLDDTLAQGGTLAQLKTHIEREGGHVVLATSLTAKDYSRKLALDPDTLRKVRGRFGPIESWWKQQFGHGFDGLTESEARAILTYDKGRLSPDALRNRVDAGRIPEIQRVGEAAVGDRPGAEASGSSGRQTDSPAFKEFFGDSKVVDKAGQPLPVYHGTSESFHTFETERLGHSTGHMTAPLGTFFAEDRAKAQRYAEQASKGVPADERVVDAYLSIQHPYEMATKPFMDIDSQEEARALRAKLMDQGYDGIHIKEFGQWISFHPEQIKSASENRGSFDKSNPNIYFRKDVDDSGRPDDPDKPRRPFSHAADSIEAMQEAMPHLDDGAMQRAKDWVSGKVQDLKPKTLQFLQLRHVLELMEDSKNFPAAKQYADTYQRMDADRTGMINTVAKEAERWRNWAYEKGPAGWLGKQKPEAKQLSRFMHEVTQLAVDPTDSYQRLLMEDSRGEFQPWTKDLVKERIKAIRNQMMSRPGDDKTEMIDKIKELQSLPAREKAREQRYPDLVAKWQALPDEAKEIFQTARQRYQEQSDAMERAILDRYEALNVPENYKKALSSMTRFRFEQSRVDGVYFPLNRTGDYWVAGTRPNGDQVFSKFETAAQAERAEKQLKAQGVEIEAHGLHDSDFKARNAPPGTFVHDVMRVLGNSGAPEKVQDEIYQMYLKSLPEMSMRKQGIHRKNIAGYSDDALRAFAKNGFHGSHQIAKLRYGYQLEGAVEAMREAFENRRGTGQLGGNTSMSLQDAATGDALLGELKRRHDWIMNPTDSKLANMINSVGFAYYLSASPASAMVQLAQNPMITLPVLGAQHSWPKAMKELSSASADSIRTGGNIRRVLKTDDERQAFDALEANGTFQRTATHMLACLSEGNALKSNPAYAKVMTAMGYMFQKAEIVNRESAGIAAYRLARDKGQPFNDAVKYADQIVNGTHFDYSNANRARFMQGNVGKVLFQFKSYSLGMSWLLYRNMYKALKDESPEVRAVARRTVTGILGMTGMFAGLMGTPIHNVLSAGANAYHAAFGDDNEPWDFDTEFRSWLADHLGSTAASVIADGVVDKLGANVSNRLGSNDMWFRDADKQLSGADAYDNMLESIAGPIGGMTKNFFVGSQQINEGHTERGIETIMPQFIKNTMKAMRYETQGANTLRGDPIVPDISGPQAVIQAMGFQPTKIAEQQRINT